MLLVINFTDNIEVIIFTARLTVNTILLIFCVLYFAFTLCLWRLSLGTIVTSIGLITVIAFSWNYIGQTNEFFCTIVAALLSLLAYKRDFKIIMQIFLACHILTTLTGMVGLHLGFTELAYKINSVDVGYSLGLIYPNHAGRMILIVLLLCWYLWGQKHKWITTIVFFLAAVLNWKIIECKTVTIICVVFPLCWWIISFLSRRLDNNRLHDKPSLFYAIFIKLWRTTLVLMPFVCFGITYLLGKNRVFFLEHWHYGQGIFALWMRFISAGVLFEAYGFPVLGRNILEENGILEIIDGHIYMADIVDNAYIYYLIAIGGIALIACMAWISFGTFRAIKNSDNALLLLIVFMCGYGLIEIAFFQFEHNFLFFYPLTENAMKYLDKVNTETMKDTA